MLSLTYFMLNDLFDQSILEPNTTMRFIQTVQQHYHQVAFHNFEHAFMVTHCVYNTLKLNPKRFNVIEVINSVYSVYMLPMYVSMFLTISQKLSLIIAGLCHDLDHPGYSNTFIKLSNHPFAVLYDEPFLENHHCWMGQLLLQVFNIHKTI